MDSSSSLVADIWTFVASVITNAVAQLLAMISATPYINEPYYTTIWSRLARWLSNYYVSLGNGARNIYRLGAQDREYHFRNKETQFVKSDKTFAILLAEDFTLSNPFILLPAGKSVIANIVMSARYSFTYTSGGTVYKVIRTETHTYSLNTNTLPCTESTTETVIDPSLIDIKSKDETCPLQTGTDIPKRLATLKLKAYLTGNKLTFKLTGTVNATSFTGQDSLAINSDVKLKLIEIR